MPRGSDPRDQRSGWKLGDHACAPYLGARQRDAIVSAFLSEGLRKHDACVCVIDDARSATVESDVKEQLAASGSATGEGYLDVWEASDIYCPDGAFRSEETFDRWKRVLDAADSNGRPIRVAADVSVSTTRGENGMRRLFWYELSCNEVFADYPLEVICLYDMERFNGGILRTIFGTHPLVLLDELLLENPGYVGCR